MDAYELMHTDLTLMAKAQSLKTFTEEEKTRFWDKFFADKNNSSEVKLRKIFLDIEELERNDNFDSKIWEALFFYNIHLYDNLNSPQEIKQWLHNWAKTLIFASPQKIVESKILPSLFREALVFSPHDQGANCQSFSELFRLLWNHVLKSRTHEEYLESILKRYRHAAFKVERLQDLKSCL